MNSPEAIRRVTRIITHADCPDGVASAMILHDVLPDAEVIAVAYGPEREALEPGFADLFCDMTPPESKVDAFVEAGAIVLDHHRGARELVERFGELGVYADADDEPGVSGAVLAYREVWQPLGGAELNNDELTSGFARLAGVRDCWLRDERGWVSACEQAEALMCYPLEHWLNYKRRGLLHHMPYMHASEGGLGRALYAKKLRRACEIAVTGCLRLGPSIAIFNADDRVVSDVAEAMREVDPDVTLVAGFFYSVKAGQMLLVFSLRSSPGAEVTARQLAAANGGGGHDHAASFTRCLWSARQEVDPSNRSPIEIFKSALGSCCL
jgi:hypothetical protein